MNPVVIGKVVWPGLVGIGAGLIKNGASFLDYQERASSLEIGSITRHLREGNVGKVVWRYAAEKSLRHNAGMPNMGAEMITEEMVKIESQIKVPWGMNVAVSPGIMDIKEAQIDIQDTVRVILSGIAPDWITINIASPDTEDSIEMLSEPQRVMALIDAVVTEVKSRNLDTAVWLKISPGMGNERLAMLARISIQYELGAMIVGNTYPDKNGGGWCGLSVRPYANAALAYMKLVVGDTLPLIGLGGVLNAKDARHKLDLGATAIQVVSGILVSGRDIAKTMSEELGG